MADTVSSDAVAQDQLRAFIERIEHVEAERKALGDDLGEIYAEAKGNGFNTKVMKMIVRRRAMDQNEAMELEALFELYMAALGMASAPVDDDDEDGEPSRARARTRDGDGESNVVPLRKPKTKLRAGRVDKA